MENLHTKIGPCDCVSPSVSSEANKGLSRVHFSDEGGEVFCGWEAPSGMLIRGDVLVMGKERRGRKEAGERLRTKKLAKRRARRASAMTLRQKRKDGKDISQDDLNLLADLVLGRL